MMRIEVTPMLVEPLTKGTEWWRQWQPGIVNSQCRDCFPSFAPLSSMRVKRISGKTAVPRW
eukprot:5227936-Amphidinium_carterae.1